MRSAQELIQEASLLPAEQRADLILALIKTLHPPKSKRVLRPKRTRKGIAEPALGTVFYEVGFKREDPGAPAVITWVYCGKVMDGPGEYYLLVEFSRWINMKRLEMPIESKHGLKIPDLEQLITGRETWAELVSWVQKYKNNWEGILGE